MTVDPSHVYVAPRNWMLMGLTSVTVLLDVTTVSSTLMNVLVSHVSMEVHVWMEGTPTAVSSGVVDSQEHIVKPQCLFVGQALSQ